LDGWNDVQNQDCRNSQFELAADSYQPWSGIHPWNTCIKKKVELHSSLLLNSCKMTSVFERFRIQIVTTGHLKGVLILFFLLLSVRAAAPEIKFFYIVVPEPISPYKQLIDAVVQVESSGNNFAWNEIEEATGAFQIRPIRLLDYNQRTGSNYKMDDCYDYDISKKIFLYYAVRIGFSDFETIARKWNGSGKTTLDYWGRIKLYL